MLRMIRLPLDTAKMQELWCRAAGTRTATRSAPLLMVGRDNGSAKHDQILQGPVKSSNLDITYISNSYTGPYTL